MERKPPSASRKNAAKELPVPDDFIAALKKSKTAMAAFQALPPSHKNEYVLWVNEAKKRETRDRRIEKAIARMVEGKGGK